VAHATYDDVRRFRDAHPHDGKHEVYILASSQVYLLCFSCGIGMTAAAIDAGLPVVHEKEPKT